MSEAVITIHRVQDTEAECFAAIKADTYADDRKKTIPAPEEVPAWYDGEWYVGLGVKDVPEARRLMEAFECYMIELNGEPAGIFWLHLEESGSMELEDLCILPQYQGKGYGFQVLAMIEALHPEISTWELSTPAYCKRNQHLYEKAGYKRIGTCSEGNVILYQKTK